MPYFDANWKNVKSVLLSNKQVTPATEIEKRHKGVQSKNRIRLYLELYLALKIVRNILMIVLIKTPIKKYCEFNKDEKKSIVHSP